MYFGAAETLQIHVTHTGRFRGENTQTLTVLISGYRTVGDFSVFPKFSIKIANYL